METTRRTQSRWKTTRTLALFLVGLGLLVLGGAGLIILPGIGQAGDQKDGSLVPAKVNYPAPDLTLTDLDDKPVSLSDYQGQVLLVNNWATWCPPCRAEMPALQAYFEAHQDQGFKVIAIDAGETPPEVGRFIREYGLTFPVWLDPDQQALMAFKNLSLPNSYVIDREGSIRLAWSGAVSLETLEKFVTPLIEE